MKLGTKLTIYLSLIIIVVLSGYGYFDVLYRRDILIRKMKVEVTGIGQTLKISLERILPFKDKEYVQDLADSIERYEKTLGVIVYLPQNDFLVRSTSLRGDLEPFLRLINESIEANQPVGNFGTFQKTSVFSYAFPLKDKKGKTIGGVTILQQMSFVEEEIRKAKWTILIAVFFLIGGTLGLVLYITRNWIGRPISQLMDGIERMAKGDLDTRISVNGKGEISKLAGAFNAMTADLKKAQDKIILDAESKLELERNLRQSEKLATIGQLASELAHEIGTPLNIISGRAELVKRRIDNREETLKNADTILLQSRRIAKIIQQLLGFVRKKRPEQTSVAATAPVEAAVEFLDPQIRRQNIEVVKDFQADLPPVVGDPDQLQQVFLNILLNAVHSMEQGGILRLSISAKCVQRKGLENGERLHLEICIADTGVGMDREVVDNVFQPFFTTKEKGTGLGLTVSQGIIQDHEGWIGVESEKGKGSVFKIYLPASPREGQ